MQHFTSNIIGLMLLGLPANVAYDQEMSQSQTADRAMTPRGRDTDSHNTIKVKQPAIFLSKIIAEPERASKTK